MSKSRSLNKVMLIGNLTRDPIIRESSSGVVVATFGIATNSSWKDGEGEVQERSEFHNVVAFNKLAEICAQVLAKGMLVYVEGELRTRVKDSQDEDGNTRTFRKTEVKINDMVLLHSKDRSPVGIDAAKEAGDDVMTRTGQEPPAEDVSDSIPNDSDDDNENIKADDLF